MRTIVFAALTLLTTAISADVVQVHFSEFQKLYQYTKQERQEVFDSENDSIRPFMFTTANNFVQVGRYSVTVKDPVFGTLSTPSWVDRKPSYANLIFGQSLFWQRNGTYVYSSGNNFLVALSEDSIYAIQQSFTPDLSVADVEGRLILMRSESTGKYSSYLLAQKPQTPPEKLDEEKTIEYLVAHENTLNGLRIEGDGIYDRFGPRNSYAAERLWNKAVRIYYIDKDHNRYDYYNGYNATGQLLVNLDGISSELGTDRFAQSLDHEGNLFIQYDGVIYYRGRDWGYLVKGQTTINDADVNLRLHPGTTELILQKLTKGESVVVLERTQQTEQVGSSNSAWFKIKSEASGKVGWVFGAFLSSPNKEVQVFDSPTLRGKQKK